MNIDSTLDRLISENILKENADQKSKHVSSGKLSASILGWPLQWQILKYLGVPAVPFDEYVLRMFLRGRHVEEYIVSQMANAQKQVLVEYKGCVGYLDALWNEEVREVKSVKNSKYSMINKNKEADPQHKLQGAYYAIGLNKPYYFIDYVAADDYRVSSFKYETNEIKPEVEAIISAYQEAIEKQIVPKFVARYKWQESAQYNNYPEFMTASPEKIKQLLVKYNVSWEMKNNGK